MAQGQRAKAEAERDQLEAIAEAEAKDLAKAQAKAAEQTNDAAQGATEAAEAARLAQGQVDRIDAHTRAGLGAGEPTKPQTHGLVGDASGGPFTEREQIEDALKG